MEDERRLYYVSMSRARETLHLFSLDSSVNPHVSVIDGDFLLKRKIALKCARNNARTYHLLGMDDLFLDFAGLKPENHLSRLAIKNTKAGDTLCLKERNSHIELMDSNGVAIARLSKKAQVEWSGRLKAVKGIRTVAIIRRYKDDLSDTDFQASCHGHSWEVPIIEFVCYL